MAPKISPLDIPEVLTQILSYVDATTIEQSACRVNRTWFLLTRHRINQELVFDTVRRRGDFNTVMARLPEATKVWWHAEYKRDRGRQWRRFVGLLRVKDLRYRERLKAIGARAGTGTGTEAGTGAAGGGTNLEELEYGYRELDLRRSSTLNNSVSWNMQERPLHELRISGFLDLNVRFPPLVAYLEFLTVLKLTMCMNSEFNLQRVLTRCGATLQVLHIRTTSAVRLIGPWIPKRFVTPEFVDLSSESWRESQLNMRTLRFVQRGDIWEDEDMNNDRSSNVLALRELVLERANFYQPHLEVLLCFTPQLETLRLIHLNRFSCFSPITLDYDQTRLVRFLQQPQFPQKQILPLKSFTFSINPIPFTINTYATNTHLEIRYVQSQLCPSSQEWTFYTKDLSTSLLKFLTEDVQNVVTTLELKNEDVHKISPDPVLHRYLCASPHLVHLRAESTIYLVELVDVFGRMDMIDSRITSQGGVATTTAATTITTGSGGEAGATGAGSLIGSPGIWACKNLQTLHISFRSASNISYSTYATTTSTTTPASSTTPTSITTASKISSRIIFGYISRVCPNLRSLNIRAAENSYWMTWMPFHHRGRTTDLQRLPLTLDSGFCLLGRLRYLEELSIGYIAGYRPCRIGWGLERVNLDWGLERVDLDWILERRGCGGGSGQKDTRKRNRREAREVRRRIMEERWEAWLTDEKVILLQKAMDASWWISRTRKTVDHTTIATAAIAAKTTNGSKSSSISSIQPPIRGRTDPEIHEQLKNLGLLEDVKNMLEEMDAEDELEEEERGGMEGGYRYWPMLRWMRVHQCKEYGRSREREVKRMLTPF